MNPWIVVAIIGLGTYLTRLSFIAAVGERGLPAWAQHLLKYVVPAVLAAIVLPAVLIREEIPDLVPTTNPRLLAAVLASLAAWRWKSVSLTIVVGMGALWILQALI